MVLYQQRNEGSKWGCSIIKEKNSWHGSTGHPPQMHVHKSPSQTAGIMNDTCGDCGEQLAKEGRCE
jgi:hypothetical protein